MTLPGWPSVRAALIAAALVANGLMALPLPKSVKRSNFDLPVAREELAAIRGHLGRLGVELTHEELADAFVAWGRPLAEARGWLTEPLKHPFRILGMGQSWGLFTYPDTWPHRLVVEARPKGGVYERLYAGLDPEHDWRRDVFVYRRVRGVYDGNTNKPGASWNNFARWTADRVFEEFRGYDEVRVFFERFHTVPPGGEPDPEVVVRHSRTFFRDAR